MTEINPTAVEFAALLAEAKVAERLCSDAKGSIEEEAAGQRVTAASNAILSARPTDPGVMAAQLRFLVAESAGNAHARGALEHIADQLEVLAGGVVLTAEAAAQVRATLLALREALELLTTPTTRHPPSANQRAPRGPDRSRIPEDRRPA